MTNFKKNYVQKRSGAHHKITIGIEGIRPLSAKIKLDLKEDLENLPILYKIDVVDFKKVSNRFKKEAEKSVKPLN